MRAQPASMRQAVGLIRSMDEHGSIAVALRSRAIEPVPQITLVFEEGTADAIRDSCTANTLSVGRWRDGLVAGHAVSPRARAADRRRREPVADGPADRPRRPDVRSRCCFSARIRATHSAAGLYQSIGAPLARKGIQLTAVLSPAALTAERLGYYDAIIIYGNHTTLAPEQEKALLDFVESGKGLVALHSASEMFAGSERTPRSSARSCSARAPAASSRPRSSSRRIPRCRACSRSRRGMKPSSSPSRTRPAARC